MENVVQESPQSLIKQAIDSKLPTEHLERLMGLQERWQAQQAKIAFMDAMSKFQKECPVIEKKKKVFEKNSIKVRYSYSPLDEIVSQVKGLIADNGLSYSFRTTNDEKNITATLRITHIQGHTEENAFSVPIGTESYMSDVQKYGARRTFAERYAFCDGFGILTGDEDTDATKETIQEEKPKNDIQEDVVVDDKMFEQYKDEMNKALSLSHLKDIFLATQSSLEKKELSESQYEELKKLKDTLKSQLK